MIRFQSLCTYQCQAGRGEAGHRAGVWSVALARGRDFWMRCKHLTTNHFLGWGFQLYLTSHFCPGVGNLTAIFWKTSNPRPMPRLSPRRLDIDRCIARPHYTVLFFWSLSVWFFSTGVHYHYNISIDFDCDKALPIFLLISEQTKSLIGFGWGGPFDVPSDEWEKPHPSVFAVST